MPIMPSPTITATTMRMILTALPPCTGWLGVGGVLAEAVTTGAGPATVGIAVPHLPQNFPPASTTAPQELQNAIDHLTRKGVHTDGGVYRKSKRNAERE